MKKPKKYTTRLWMNRLEKFGTFQVVAQILIQLSTWEWQEFKIIFNQKKKESFTFLQMDKTIIQKKLFQILKKSLVFKKIIG